MLLMQTEQKQLHQSPLDFLFLSLRQLGTTITIIHYSYFACHSSRPSLPPPSSIQQKVGLRQEFIPPICFLASRR